MEGYMDYIIDPIIETALGVTDSVFRMDLRPLVSKIAQETRDVTVNNKKSPFRDYLKRYLMNQAGPESIQDVDIPTMTCIQLAFEKNPSIGSSCQVPQGDIGALRFFYQWAFSLCVPS
ncbi:hypothetical protein SEMRO_1808_G298980.1 [Seminavis robusta]|uniref:Uncharacterized protein n=1 Tax=Seminavis robusta TaxID=568900 RepID=A0A9N8ET83_9STRA|nr:hypothetical protein SEMRO_1808_G298980.1 [Seminavis robusta]|eukprot:Sro1808_g298980.1 n/a (118) ;mRNA; r:3483-3920